MIKINVAHYNTLILIFLLFLAENRVSRYFLKVSSCEFRAASQKLSVSDFEFRASDFVLFVFTKVQSLKS